MIFCYKKGPNEVQAVKGDSHQEAFQAYKDTYDEWVGIEELLFVETTYQPIKYKLMMVADLES